MIHENKQSGTNNVFGAYNMITYSSDLTAALGVPFNENNTRAWVAEGGIGEVGDISKLYDNGPAWMYQQGILPEYTQVKDKNGILLFDKNNLPILIKWLYICPMFNTSGDNDYWMNWYLNTFLPTLTDPATAKPYLYSKDGGGDVGLSLGGSGADPWITGAFKMPFRLNGFCSLDGTTFLETLAGYQKALDANVDAIWDVQNVNDPVVNSGYESSLVSTVLGFNPSYDLTLSPGLTPGAHSGWNEMYKTLRIHDFLALKIFQYGKLTSASAPVTVNKLPVANAGPSQTIQLPAVSVQLDGSGSADGDGTIVAWNWTITNQPAGSKLTTMSGVKLEIPNPIAGTYVLSLSVTDNQGGVSAQPSLITIVVKSVAVVVPPPVTVPPPATGIAPVYVAMGAHSGTPVGQKDPALGYINVLPKFDKGTVLELLDNTGKDSGIKLSVLDARTWASSQENVGNLNADGPQQAVGTMPAWAIGNCVYAAFLDMFELDTPAVCTLKVFCSRMDTANTVHRSKLGTQDLNIANNLDPNNLLTQPLVKGANTVQIVPGAGSTYSYFNFLEIV